MGTGTHSRNPEEVRCSICRRVYTPQCDFQQGRCPHHKPMIEIQPKDTSRGHFYVSIVKSATRIAAGIAMVSAANIVLAGALLIAAEVLGILEEMV